MGEGPKDSQGGKVTGLCQWGDPHSSAVAVANVQQRSPDHANAGVVIDVEEGELLLVLATEDDEEGVEEVEELGEVVDVHKPLNAGIVR